MVELRKALIVGGGIGGMCASICLQRQGTSVDLVEIDPTWRAAGAGLTLNGASLRAFQSIGVLEPLVREAHIHKGRRVHDADGRVLFEEPYRRPEAGDINAGGGVLRPVLHSILSDATREAGVNVRLGVTIETLAQRADGVDVQFSNGDQANYDLVIGADGLMSKVREIAFKAAPRPAFTGQGCWRAVFKRPKEINTTWIFLGDRIKAGLNPVSEQEMYMFLLESAPGNPWREPREFENLLAERMCRFGGVMPTLATQLGPDARINYRPLETLLLPAPWHNGRVVLLGDACHATTPHAGYGAGLAVEDAIILSESLRGGGTVESRLQTYARRRFARCESVLSASVRLGEMEMAGAPLQAQMAQSSYLFDATRMPI